MALRQEAVADEVEEEFAVAENSHLQPMILAGALIAGAGVGWGQCGGSRLGYSADC